AREAPRPWRARPAARARDRSPRGRRGRSGRPGRTARRRAGHPPSRRFRPRGRSPAGRSAALGRCRSEQGDDRRDRSSAPGAAPRIGATEPTAGRHIEALEVAVGASLFTRSPRGLVPTAAARELVPHAEAMAAAAASLHRAASGEALGESGTVRVTASQLIGHEVLPPILAEFGWRHPRIALELSLSDRQEDMLRGDADIAVRMARPTQKSLVVRRIAGLKLGVFAHRRYAQAVGLPQAPEA